MSLQKVSRGIRRELESYSLHNLDGNITISLEKDHIYLLLRFEYHEYRIKYKNVANGSEVQLSKRMSDILTGGEPSEWETKPVKSVDGLNRLQAAMTDLRTFFRTDETYGKFEIRTWDFFESDACINTDRQEFLSKIEELLRGLPAKPVFIDISLKINPVKQNDLIRFLRHLEPQSIDTFTFGRGAANMVLNNRLLRMGHWDMASGIRLYNWNSPFGAYMNLEEVEFFDDILKTEKARSTIEFVISHSKVDSFDIWSLEIEESFYDYFDALPEARHQSGFSRSCIDIPNTETRLYLYLDEFEANPDVEGMRCQLNGQKGPKEGHIIEGERNEENIRAENEGNVS